MSAARRQLQLLANPFLNNGAEPKIPDGMCSSSMGIRQQAATEFTQYDEYLDIVFWPGLASGCMVIGQTGGADGKGVRADMEYTGTTICEVPVDEFGTKLVFQKFNKVSRWRIVSQGAKISLTNNADDNDGWFEAIRFVPPNDEGKMYLVNNILDPGTNLADNCHLGPDQSIWDLHGNTSLVSHPSFITGKLRDIHRYNWNLHHFENSFDFTNCQHKYTLSLATDKTAIPAGKALDANGFKYRAFDENEANADFVNSFIDRKMDAILVRIHGKGKKKHSSCQHIRNTNQGFDPRRSQPRGHSLPRRDTGKIPDRISDRGHSPTTGHTSTK